MPELPDLQVFSANLDKQLAGKVLDELTLVKGAKSNVSAAELKKALEGKKLDKVYREGKELRFAFGNKCILGLHLMLRGKLLWMEKGKIPPHSLLALSFSGGIQLAVTDYQRNARITLNPESSAAPDALSKEANLKF